MSRRLTITKLDIFDDSIDSEKNGWYTVLISYLIEKSMDKGETIMKRRSDSAFGLHFDFHASPAPGKVIGATLTEDQVREICRSIKPDFIQVDCKGHPGWASYPTECGNAMPEFAYDTLEMWRRVTREEGVALYMHYSGVFDMNYCTKYPEDAVVGADGSKSKQMTRTYGFSYADRLLIPQLKELAGKYGVDGVWVDGECWATSVDFHPDTVAAFEKETGISLNGKLPASRGDEYFEEYRDFCREAFRAYVRHYVDAVHAEYPDFQIASNWGYTDHMPEAVTSDVDYLSGDFDPWNSFGVARYAGRFLAGQNKPWDLMAWNFRNSRGTMPDFAPKHPMQIMQEAAAVLSVGGGFQNYITQYGDGGLRMEEIRRMKPVAEFVRARQNYCFRAKAVHQAAVLLSQYDRKLESGGLFSRDGYLRTVGLTSLFCDIGQSTEILCEHTLGENIGEYKIIAVPELAYGLREETVDQLLKYAENGGALLLAGMNTARIFAEKVGFTVDSADRSNEWRFATVDQIDDGRLRNVHNVNAEGAETVLWVSADERNKNESGAIVMNYGKGKVAVIGADIGSSYLESTQFIQRRALKTVCDKLYTPIVKVENVRGLLELTLTEKDGKTFVQLINANGAHASGTTATEDFIPAVTGMKLSIALDKAPAKMILHPKEREIPFVYEDGRAIADIGMVDLYDILEIVE